MPSFPRPHFPIDGEKMFLAERPNTLLETEAYRDDQCISKPYNHMSRTVRNLELHYVEIME